MTVVNLFRIREGPLEESPKEVTLESEIQRIQGEIDHSTTVLYFFYKALSKGVIESNRDLATLIRLETTPYSNEVPAISELGASYYVTDLKFDGYDVDSQEESHVRLGFAIGLSEMYYQRLEEIGANNCMGEVDSIAIFHLVLNSLYDDINDFVVEYEGLRNLMSSDKRLEQNAFAFWFDGLIERAHLSIYQERLHERQARIQEARRHGQFTKLRGLLEKTKDDLNYSTAQE